MLIKPSHYDDDGYVIRWYRSPMPANSLASVYGLIDDCAQRKILGPDIDIDIVAIDETNTRVRVDRIIADMRANDNFGFVGLVGVQSNQYPRSLHIAKPLRDAGIPVIIGGFHVSGMLAMFPTVMADLQQALDMGVTLFAGEAEGRMDEVVRDAAAGALKPLYNYIDDLPALEDAVTPFLPGNSVRKTIGNVTTFDAGRGCPFQCSFCTIINVQGRKSRRRSPDDVERILRKNYEHGIDRFFITDDNFARNKDWEPIFDRIIKLREARRHGRALPDPGRHAVPQDPEFRRQGEARRRHPHFHRAGEHQSRQSARRQEAAEQDHRIPQHAAGLEGGRHLDLCRLHSRLPQRHAGIGAARHRDHQEGNAARRARVLLPHAAAGFRGSQGAVRTRACRSIPTSTNTISNTRSRRMPI